MPGTTSSAPLLPLVSPTSLPLNASTTEFMFACRWLQASTVLLTGVSVAAICFHAVDRHVLSISLPHNLHAASPHLHKVHPGALRSIKATPWLTAHGHSHGQNSESSQMHDSQVDASEVKKVVGGESHSRFSQLLLAVSKVMAMAWIASILRCIIYLVKRKQTQGQRLALLAASGEQKSPEVRLETSRLRAGQYNAQEIRDQLDDIIYKSPVVLFAQDECSVSNEVKAFLKQQRVECKIVEVDAQPDGDAMRLELALRTGIGAMPMTFVGGSCIGGYTDLLRLHMDAKLQPLLNAAGAKFSTVDERSETAAPVSADDMINTLRQQIDSVQMAELKARIARNMAAEGTVDADEELEGSATPTSASAANLKGSSRTAVTPEPISSLGRSRRRGGRVDAITEIKQEEEALLAVWTSEPFYVAGGFSAIGTLFYFITQMGL